MDFGIEGKWALVCGASKGLGLGCAQALVGEGVNLVINARAPDALHQAASQLIAIGADRVSAIGQNGLKPQVLAVAADITTPEGRAAVFGAAGGPGTDFDIVVTNAGGPPTGDFRDWDREAWIRAVDANMLTPMELMRATVDGMAARGNAAARHAGHKARQAAARAIGQAQDVNGRLDRAGCDVDDTAKAARGVTINNLLPGKFDTDRLAATVQAAAARAGRSVDDLRRTQQAAIPAGRYGTAQEFGAICAFLCSQQAGYVTGQNILADGGAYPGTF